LKPRKDLVIRIIEENEFAEVIESQNPFWEIDDVFSLKLDRSESRRLDYHFAPSGSLNAGNTPTLL
jgi:hypothetical protein